MTYPIALHRDTLYMMALDEPNCINGHPTYKVANGMDKLVIGMVINPVLGTSHHMPEDRPRWGQQYIFMPLASEKSGCYLTELMLADMLSCLKELNNVGVQPEPGTPTAHGLDDDGVERLRSGTAEGAVTEDVWFEDGAAPGEVGGVD